MKLFADLNFINWRLSFLESTKVTAKVQSLSENWNIKKWPYIKKNKVLYLTY